MSARKGSSKKRAAATPTAKSAPPLSKFRVQEDFDPDFSSDLKGIMSALHQFREKTEKEGQKKKEETISSVASEIRTMLNDLKTKIEKDRQSFGKALQKNSKECENYIKSESAKIQDIYEKFAKEKAAHMQSMQDTMSKFEEDKEKLMMRYEQLKKKEKSMLADHEKACEEKIAKLEESLKKKKQDGKTFSILKKTLGTFLDDASDEDFPPED
ncbi:unnamed protein product [Linum trigynum]|uniref:Uncharacterized protein n=1 Tax=Linum trigynum TaxID=586398 RepID=A0AAV2FKG8_9ROSI